MEIKSAILSILAGGPLDGVMVSVLRQQSAQLYLRRQIGDHEWADAVRRMKGKRLIEDGEPDTITDDATLKLTEAGWVEARRF